jgi:glycosyltransferase involved in cell wall biosynthesis
MNFSLVIPIYNNKASINELYSRICNTFELTNLNNNSNLEIVFVDDHSLDGSFEEIKNLKPVKNITIKLLNLYKNTGQLYATLIGLRNSSYEKIIVMSADLQDPPELIQNFMEKFKAGSRLVLAIRKSVKENIFKKFTSYLHYILIRFSVKNYPRKGFDFYGFDREVMEKWLSIDNYFLSQVDLLNIEKKYEIIEYNKKARKYGKSQSNFFSRLDLSINQVFASAKWPLRIFLLIGLSFSFLALTSTFFIFIDYFFEESTQHLGWRSIVSLLLLGFGILFIILFVIGEYISRIYTILRKPHLGSIQKQEIIIFKNEHKK